MTPATIAITPGAGQFLDAVSLTVGPNLVVRETMVIADATNPTEMAVVSSGALSVFLPTAQITALTPPTAAAIAAAIVANPPTVAISGTIPISGTIAATQSGTWNIGSVTTLPAITIAAAQTIGVTQASAAALNATVVGTGTFVVQASITTLGQQLAAASVPVVLTASQLATLTPPTIVAVTQSTSPWVVSQSGNWTTRIVGNAGATLDGTAGSPSTGVLTIQGSTASGFPLNIAGATGSFLDQASGSGKRTNALQVAGNDGTNQYPIPMASAGTAVLVTPGAPTVSKYSQAAITFSASGDNTLIVGSGSTTIRIYRIFFVNSDAAQSTNITIKDSTPTSFSGAFRLNSGGSVGLDGNGDPLYVGASGKGIVLNSSAAVQVSGTVWYTQS